MVAPGQTRSLQELKNLHAGKRAFVIGNGPSLRVEDLDLLNDEITFACNKIYLAFSETAWRPTYYTVEDHLVARQNREAIEALQGVVKFFPHTLSLHGMSFSNCLEYPLIWKDVFPKLPGFSDDAEAGFHWGSTVTYTMMQMAFYTGVREVFLMGVDFSFVIPARCDTPTGKFKVYICEGECNHFHPEYRKPGERWHQPNLAYQEKSYLAARSYAEAKGVRILNATRGGRLEIFPRVDLDAVVKG
jgi:hypothetical protein